MWNPNTSIDVESKAVAEQTDQGDDYCDLAKYSDNSLQPDQLTHESTGRDSIPSSSTAQKGASSLKKGGFNAELNNKNDKIRNFYH